MTNLYNIDQLTHHNWRQHQFIGCHNRSPTCFAISAT